MIQSYIADHVWTNNILRNDASFDRRVVHFVVKRASASIRRSSIYVKFKIRNMKKAKKTQDKDKPKRPQTAFMLWLNESRSKIKAKNPDMKVTEIAKEGGRQWRELEDKSKWETKAKDAKRLYEEAMKAYKAKQDVD
ncbi:hypothetical protein WA026_016042 [Henosepilachna vigintioctopunctata]|uniref:HMG box domain-containing protein n=1 Tax=Henosepilachna vigintioctopunctata TaxID=420089 RepID=A0AAW1U3F8_9CUCU